MARIYADAHVTIIAASAKSVNEGFLGTRSTVMQGATWFKLPFARPNGEMGEISVRGHIVYRAVNEPINYRAWTLHEDVMSPRVLTYDSHWLRWECQSVRWSDGGLESQLKDCQGMNRRLALRRLYPPEEKRSRNFDARLDNLEDYSWRGLSEVSENLPAISSIAQAYSRLLCDQYLAGSLGEPFDSRSVVA
jgi:hypothetical protein